MPYPITREMTFEDYTVFSKLIDYKKPVKEQPSPPPPQSPPPASADGGTNDALNERKKKRKVVSLTTPDLIFPDGDDPYEPLVITRFFARLCKRIGVDYDLYDLRHTYATNLARQGVHPAKIQYLMGHSRPTMALDAYIHIDTSHLDDVADTVSASISEKKSEQKNEAENIRVVSEVVK